MKWPWPTFENGLGEIIPGDLIIVAGRTGSGKTTFAMNLAWALAKIETRVGYLALECGADIPLWFSLMEMGVSRFAQRDPEMVDKLAEAALLPGWPTGYLEVIDLPFPEPAVMLKEVERLSALYDVVIVDHIAAMDMGNQRQQERQVYGRVVRQLKTVADRCGIPVVVAHQVGRGERQRQDTYRPPKLEDLYGSALIEHTASIVLGIYRSLDQEGRNLLSEYNKGANVQMWRHELGMGVQCLKARHGARRYDLHLMTARNEDGHRTDRLIDDDPDYDGVNRNDMLRAKQ